MSLDEHASCQAALIRKPEIIMPYLFAKKLRHFFSWSHSDGDRWSKAIRIATKSPSNLFVAATVAPVSRLRFFAGVWPRIQLVTWSTVNTWIRLYHYQLWTYVTPTWVWSPLKIKPIEQSSQARWVPKKGESHVSPIEWYDYASFFLFPITMIGFNKIKNTLYLAK